MIRITHPRPELGRRKAFGLEFVDGIATAESLHSERELALTQHGFSIAEAIDAVPLEDLTKAELRDIADVEGIDIPSKATKRDIISALNAADIPVLE